MPLGPQDLTGKWWCALIRCEMLLSLFYITQADNYAMLGIFNPQVAHWRDSITQKKFNWPITLGKFSNELFFPKHLEFISFTEPFNLIQCFQFILFEYFNDCCLYRWLISLKMTFSLYQSFGCKYHKWKYVLILL